MCRDADGASVAVEIKRRGEIDGVEQLTRYLELLNRDPLLAPVRGIFAAQEIKPQARVLATDRGIACAVVDYDALRGMDDPDAPAVLTCRIFHIATAADWAAAQASGQLHHLDPRPDARRGGLHPRAAPTSGRACATGSTPTSASRWCCSRSTPTCSTSRWSRRRCRGGETFPHVYGAIDPPPSSEVTALGDRRPEGPGSA